MAMESRSTSQTAGSLAMGNEATNLQDPPTKEKTKRPQLSCNACRQRKVKCDRIQPCTACSLHQIADGCHYDLTESERHPILQAEALREKDKEIARLRFEVLSLGGPSPRPNGICGDFDSRKKRKSGFNVRGGKKPTNIRSKRAPKADSIDSIYFGAPCMANVINELADLTIRSKAASLAHSPPRRSEASSPQEALSHPFPTLWAAKDGISALITLIPSKDEVASYLDSFQGRAQGCSFPHVPEECTRYETERFMANLERNALLHPDMLALLFATLAQGLQHGLYDRCGEQWVAGRREHESKKGDVFVAASMQALRLANFMNRPTLLVVETLVMIGSYLVDSGKLLDAWALFGITIRLAQAIGLHRDPCHLRPCPPPEEVNSRKNIWWWILHMDQQYSVSLGRPLGISSIGDCPTPTMLRADPAAQSLSNYHSQFSILARQVLSAGYLNNTQIDQLTDQLLALQDTLPESVRFDESWLEASANVPGWPMNAQAASLHQKTHNFVILLNRQRVEEDAMDIGGHRMEIPGPLSTDTLNTRGKLRGYERVIASCRAILAAFEFFHSHVRVGMKCWTICQQAFSAANILVLSILETNNMENYPLVCRAYDTFLEIHQLGIHRLAGAAAERLEGLLMSYQSDRCPVEKVMSNQGMALLEDVDVQTFEVESNEFNSLSFGMPDCNQDMPPSRRGSDYAPSISNSHTNIEQDDKPPKKSKTSPYTHHLNTSSSSLHRHKASVKKASRKDASASRRPSGPAGSGRELLQLNLMNAFSAPGHSTPIYHDQQHQAYSSELPTADIQSTLDHSSAHLYDSGTPSNTGSRVNTNATTSPTAAKSTSSPHSAVAGMASAPASYTSSPGMFPQHYLSSSHNSSLQHQTHAPHTHNQASHAGHATHPSGNISSHLFNTYSSYPSSSYNPSTYPSSLNTPSSLTAPSSLNTPSASHPVSPSLSYIQISAYCKSGRGTRAQSPVWEGWDGLDGVNGAIGGADGGGVHLKGLAAEGQGAGEGRQREWSWAEGGQAWDG